MGRALILGLLTAGALFGAGCGDSASSPSADTGSAPAAQPKGGPMTPQAGAGSKDLQVNPNAKPVTPGAALGK